MACPRCALRLARQSNGQQMRIPRRRAFHTSPSRQQRLGAFTYGQEWNTGTYHYNKATSKNFPTALMHADNLLTAYATQTKRRTNVSDKAVYNQLVRNSITSHRRSADKTFFSKATVKDYGDKVVVNAFMYDAHKAKMLEEEAKKKRMMGVREGGAQRGEGQRRRGPAARRRVGGVGVRAGGTLRLGAGRASQGAPAFRRVGGAGGASRGPPRGQA